MGKALVSHLTCTLLVLLVQESVFFLVIRATDDAEALLRLKSWITRPSGALSSWQRSSFSSLCSWSGISCISGTRNVESIHLSGQGLSFALRDGLGSLTKLRHLNLSLNNINGEIPNDFSRLSSLETLDLSNNIIESAIPKFLGNLRNLQLVNIKGNLISGLFPNNLCNAPRLRSIDASNNQLIGPLTEDLRNCSLLETLNLASNRLATNFPRRLSSLRSLHYFNIAYNMFKGQIPSDVPDIVELTEFIVQANILTGTLPSSIGRCRYLSNLDVSSNKLSGYIPNSLGNLILLENLQLAHNSFQGNIPSELGALTSLKVRLDLSHNRLIGEIPATLGNLNMVTVMDFSSNLLSGQLPESIGSCSSLRELSVADNFIAGHIPEGWVALSTLESFNLSRNKLDGSLSSSLGYMVALAVIDLSHNNFSGEIPSWLSALPRVSLIDLSVNSLQGAVPKFSSQTQVFLSGNKDLCGEITNIPCPIVSQNGSSENSLSTSHLIAENVGIGLAILAFFTVIAPLLWIVCFRHFQPDSYDAMIDELQTHPPRLIVCLRRFSKWCPQCVCLRQRINIQVIRTATNGFSDANIIGTGQNFTVYSAVWPSETPFTEKKVVVKRLQPSHQNQIPYYLQQTRALFHVQHCNVLRIVDWCSHSEEFCVLVGSNVNGSLDYYLYNSDIVAYLGWEQRLKIALNVANGLSYLHKKWWGARVIHCNLQPSNILLDENFEPQISGLRYCLRSNLKKLVHEESEASYMSPECIHSEPLTKESQVYSFGVFVLELLTRQVPELCTSKLGMPLERWVRAVFSSMRTQIVDYVVLQTAPTEEHVVALLKVALLCTEEEPKLRPQVLEIISKLQKLLNLDYVPEEDDARNLNADAGTSSPPIHSRFEDPRGTSFEFFA
ncbi:hypothetical protein L7F22_066190 [Adiantum nelumboides]|nr:hypothetical protein [Adiantum nelumboides]